MRESYCLDNKGVKQLALEIILMTKREIEQNNELAIFETLQGGLRLYFDILNLNLTGKSFIRIIEKRKCKNERRSNSKTITKTSY